MNQPELKVARSGVKTVTTTVTTTVTLAEALAEAQYEPILRKAVGAPDDAEVRIPDGYGSDILITWTTTEYADEAGE